MTAAAGDTLSHVPQRRWLNDFFQRIGPRNFRLPVIEASDRSTLECMAA
jgi:hypothetical protein